LGCCGCCASKSWVGEGKEREFIFGVVLEELGEGIVGELEGFKVKKILGVGDFFDSGT